MHRLALVLVASVLVSALGVSAPATAAQPQKSFDSCKELKKQYPKGVAQSSKAARLAFNDGKRRPPVRKSVYNKNKELDKRGDGYVCASTRPVSVPQPAAPVPQPPQQVANLTVVGQTPTRQDQRANFNISWQMPAAADVTSYLVRLSDGSSKTVLSNEGVYTTPAVRTYTAQAFGPFNTPVEISVIAINAVGQSSPAIAQFTTPPEPKRTITVEISAGSGDCSGYNFCYVSITNATGGTDVHYSMGSWSYEANPGLSVYAYVSAGYQNSSTCTIRFDGAVVATQTSNGSHAWCSARVPS